MKKLLNNLKKNLMLSRKLLKMLLAVRLALINLLENLLVKSKILKINSMRKKTEVANYKTSSLITTASFKILRKPSIEKLVPEKV